MASWNLWGMSWRIVAMFEVNSPYPTMIMLWVQLWLHLWVRHCTSRKDLRVDQHPQGIRWLHTPVRSRELPKLQEALPPTLAFRNFKTQLEMKKTRNIFKHFKVKQSKNDPVTCLWYRSNYQTLSNPQVRVAYSCSSWSCRFPYNNEAYSAQGLWRVHPKVHFGSSKLCCTHPCIGGRNAKPHLEWSVGDVTISQKTGRQQAQQAQQGTSICNNSCKHWSWR